MTQEQMQVLLDQHKAGLNLPHVLRTETTPAGTLRHACSDAEVEKHVLDRADELLRTHTGMLHVEHAAELKEMETKHVVDLQAINQQMAVAERKHEADLAALHERQQEEKQKIGDTHAKRVAALQAQLAEQQKLIDACGGLDAMKEHTREQELVAIEQQQRALAERKAKLAGV